MSDDAPLKSAFELAMDRLRAEDRERGAPQARPLTDEQKATIGELRAKARAKLAELEILHAKDMAVAAADPAKLTELEARYEADRRRIESSLESAVARVREGKPPSEVD